MGETKAKRYNELPPNNKILIKDFSVFQLASALDRKLCECIDGDDAFLGRVAAVRRALRELKKNL